MKISIKVRGRGGGLVVGGLGKGAERMKREIALPWQGQAHEVRLMDGCFRRGVYARVRRMKTEALNGQAPGGA